ncbi:hypothetical protein YC2023_049037 [Brassica napus]
MTQLLKYITKIRRLEEPFFAKTSAEMITELEKENNAKPEEIERMSFTKPMISLDWKLPEITLMSVELLEKFFEFWEL